MNNSSAERSFSTILIGAGQAGLSVARYLKEMGKEDFLILDEGPEIGSSWKNRYDSLELDSFAKYSHLEDFHFSGDKRKRPTKDEVADYLALFAQQFGLQPIFNTKVTSISKRNGEFIIGSEKGILYYAKSVVVATGPFHREFIPALAANIGDSVLEIHSSEYKNPEELPTGSVLVVGGGNSGAEIAEEVALSGRHVYFSYKGKLKSVGSTHLHQWLAYRLGLAHLPKKSVLGSLAVWYTKGKAVGLDIKKLLGNHRIKTVGELVGIKDGTIFCKNLAIPLRDIETIIWATGFVDDFSLIEVDEFDPKKVKRGVSNISGLYLINLRWHHSKSSSHLAGVSRDAKYIAQKISAILD